MAEFNWEKIKLIERLDDEVEGENTETALTRTFTINKIIQKTEEQTEYINALIQGIEDEKERLHYMERVPRDVYPILTMMLQSYENILKPLRSVIRRKENES